MTGVALAGRKCFEQLLSGQGCGGRELSDLGFEPRKLHRHYRVSAKFSLEAVTNQ